MWKLLFLTSLSTLVLSSSLASATPYCFPPADPQVHPGAELADAGAPGPVSLGSSCSIYLFSKTVVKAGELELRSSQGAHPLTLTEGAPVTSYPDGFDCSCNLTYTTDHIHAYVIKPDSPLPHNEQVKLLRKTTSAGQSTVTLAEFAVSKDLACDPTAGAKLHVECTTCDVCIDPSTPDGGTVPADAGTVKGDAINTPLREGGCQLGGAPTDNLLPLALLLGCLWLRRQRSRA